ncbi:MAG: flagellar assembly protein FliW [Deltaproteobacteria bacterium]|nr:flagellar assembly protein FliW [Deltaproteobacteria bacterium]
MSNDIKLKGKILGFEECRNFAMSDFGGKDSPFRLLSAEEGPFSFILVNPYHILDEYSFEVDEKILENEVGLRGNIGNLAIMCIVRVDGDTLYVNLRSPLLINIKEGRFTQIVLENESYGVSVPFAVKKESENKTINRCKRGSKGSRKINL